MFLGTTVSSSHLMFLFFFFLVGGVGEMAEGHVLVSIIRNVEGVEFAMSIWSEECKSCS